MAQEERQKESLVKTRTRAKEPKRFVVFILNDDFTTFDFVIHVMVSVFMKSQAQAEEIAETTHLNQKAKVGEYPYDIAISRVEKATAMARAEGFPLRFTVEQI